MKFLKSTESHVNLKNIVADAAHDAERIALQKHMESRSESKSNYDSGIPDLWTKCCPRAKPRS